MDFEKIAEQNRWWKGAEAIERDYDIERWKNKKVRWIPKIVNKISIKPFALHILLGPRQAGKTTALKLLIRKLLDNTDPKSIFFFNCEELADHKELAEVIESYIDYRNANGINRSIIILDEITLPKEWYRAIKFLIDTGKFQNDVVIVTGSTNIAVKKHVELFPGRRGFGEDIVIMPVSFRNFVEISNPELYEKIRNVKIENLADIIVKTAKAAAYVNDLNKELEKYFDHGGFPLSIASMGDKLEYENAKKVYLSWIKNVVLKAERSDVIARQIVKSIAEKMPSPISWEGIAKDIEIKSPKTVSAYISLLKSAFVFCVLYNTDINKPSIKFGKNKKIHVSDPLLLHVFEDWCTISVKNKKFLLAESVAASHITRMFPDRVFFWKNGFEIDLLVLDKDSKYHGIEIKYGEKQEGKKIPQLKSFVTLTKNEFSAENSFAPLSVFLALLDI